MGSQRHTIYYACKYTPLEMLAGFGAGCELAEADVASFEAAERLAHANLCGYAKGLLQRLIADDVREVVLVSCCDAVKRVYDVLLREGKKDFLYLLDLPHLRGEAEVSLFRERLADLAAAYADYSGASFDIARALGTYTPRITRTDERVTLLGAHASASLIEATQTVGLPVENLTCTGPRTLPAPPRTLARIEPSGECTLCADPSDGRPPLERFLDWYAEALLDQMPCMRMDHVAERGQALGGTGQRGIIYHTMRFCDYYGFEHARLRDLKDLPQVKIETDGTSQSSGQLATRLDAFAETLAARQKEDHMAHNADRDPKSILVLGVDSGSTSTDAVLMDGLGTIRGTSIVPTGVKSTEAAERAEAEALAAAGVGSGDVTLRIGTGYGRDSLPGMDSSITEITCHAAGAHRLAPDARTVIDIGGQDSKVIHLAEDGSVMSFVMNDKCAAGTGRFLESLARTMGMPIEEFSTKGLEWRHEVRISSVCTVFAESEVVSLVAKDTPAADIIHGLNISVAKKTSALAGRAGGEPPYLMTGGVARNQGVVDALSEVLGAPVATSEDSQLCGAIGAAILGLGSLGIKLS
jgi:predicted CoA-substrate-specific enzyme activase